MEVIVENLTFRLTEALEEELELESLERKMVGIRTVLDDAEGRAFHDPTVRAWLASLKDVVYDADDIIDERRTHYERLDRLRFCRSLRRFQLRQQPSEIIKSIKERLVGIKDQSDQVLIAPAPAPAPAPAARDDPSSGRSWRSLHRLTTSASLEPGIVIGKGSDCGDLVRLLTAARSSSNIVIVPVVAIVGVGGSGKTTLAQMIYMDPTIRENFRIMLWVCVSHYSSDTALLREVIRAAGGKDPGSGHDRSFAELQGLLTEAIGGKKFLLVLDDVWSAQVWDDLLQKPLQNGAEGSRILITTRAEGVAMQMGAVHLHVLQDGLSAEEGWSLLSMCVFGRNDDDMDKRFRDIGKQIVVKCNGLPLAIRTIAGVLRTKADVAEWGRVLQRFDPTAAYAAPVEPYDRAGGSRETPPADWSRTREPDIVGTQIESDSSNLVSLLSAEYLDTRVRIVAIVGMCGIGKTTLAKKILGHPTILEAFRTPPPMRVRISQDYSDTALLGEVIRAAGGRDPGGYHDRSSTELQGLLSEAIEGKKFLLVLDDVWRGQFLEDLLIKPLQHGAAVGSRILITTRDERVAMQMGAVNIHKVQPLSHEDGWSLLCKLVPFQEGDDRAESVIKDIGMQIVKRCDGVPLVIRSIAKVLRTEDKTRKAWKAVLESQQVWAMLLSSTDLPNEVMGALNLSYEDLPYPLKQCFVYCSLFPEGYVFRRDDIIRHWISQGFVVEGEGSMTNMEEVAEGYYQDLINRSLLEPHLRAYGSGESDDAFKVQQIFLPLARYLAPGEFFVGDIENLVKATRTATAPPSKLRHLSIANDTVQSPMAEYVGTDHKCSRTLLFLCSISLKEDDLDYLLRKLGRLRVLQFVKSSRFVLPDSVGNLLHLRFLDLSCSFMSELPETIGSLSNLRYLILRGCRLLKNLPKGIAKLYNLRTLDLLGTPVTGMPVGIRRLQHLNRLIGFVTNESNIGGRRRETSNGSWCSLKELGYLSQLRAIIIRNLDRAVIRRTDSRGNLLKDKQHLYRMALCCAPCRTDGKPYGDEEVKQIQSVFDEELFPPPSLQVLEIDGYFGLQFPSWMMTSSSIALTLCNLTRLELVSCDLCPQLPPLGLLPNLDYLEIKCASTVESIGPEFLGVGHGGDAQPSSRRVPFPKLKTLVMRRMYSWVEWLWGAEDEATAMPCLQKLDLDCCPKLTSLPPGLRHATALQKIDIRNTNLLGGIENLDTVKDLSIHQSPKLVRISNLHALLKLAVEFCPLLSTVEGLNSLNSLELVDFEMYTLPDWLRAIVRDRGQPPSLANRNSLLHQRYFVSYTRDPYSFRTNVKSDGA